MGLSPLPAANCEFSVLAQRIVSALAGVGGCHSSTNPRGGRPERSASPVKGIAPTNDVPDQRKLRTVILQTPVIIPRCLSVKQSAEYLGVGPRKIRALIQGGKIPLVQDSPGAVWRIDRGDLDKYIESNKVTWPF
jgi:excisionase family DNA binding protein